MDALTHKLFIQYRRKPTEANKQALLERMGIRYDKVVARKKNKLRELEREARTYAIVEHMQGIVNEMVENRDIRIQQQFVRFIDPRRDENPDDAWMVLRGASAQNAYIGYAPVLSPMPNMPNSMLNLCMTKGKTIILPWASPSRMQKPIATGSPPKPPNIPIAYRAKKSGFSQQDTCPRMLQ